MKLSSLLCLLRSTFASVLFALLSGYAIADEAGFHCPSDLTGGVEAREHPFSSSISCPAGQGRYLNRDSSDQIIVSRHGHPQRYCGRCYTVSEMNNQRWWLVDPQFKDRTERFRFNGKDYYNFDVDTSPGLCTAADDCPLGHWGDIQRSIARTQKAFCEDWLSGRWSESAKECSCASGLAPNSLHGTCEVCPTGTRYVSPVSGSGNNTGSCRPVTAEDCDINTEFHAIEGVGGTCESCGAGEESDGREDRCECRSGYDRLNANACTNAHHRACQSADFRIPIATNIFTDHRAAPEPGDCRAARDTSADRAICHSLNSEFVRIDNGACAVQMECTTDRPYSVLLEVAEIATDAGTCVTEEECALILDGFAGMGANGDVCRLALNDEECGAIRNAQIGKILERRSGVGPVYDQREEHDCRPRAAGDCEDDHEFVTSDEFRLGGTCEACEEYETSTNGDACIPRTAANCAFNYKFTARNGGGICELRAARDCEDDHEFMADASGGGICDACPPNEVSRNGVACRCPDTHFENPDNQLCAERTDPSICADTAFVDPNTNRCTPCPVANHVRGENDMCECPALYFEEDAAGQCSPRAAANCPADHEFEPAPREAAGGTCEMCHDNEVSRNGAPCECVTGHTRDLADDSCRLPSNSQECADVREEFPIYASDVGSCVAATSSAQCLENLPTRPIFFVSGICRAATTDRQCEINHPDFPIRNGPRCEAIPCAPPGLVVDGVCKPRPECTAPETPNAVNECECQDPNVVVSGVCEVLTECAGAADRNMQTNRCECNEPNVEVAGVCEVPVNCPGNLTANEQNECHCNLETHFGSIISCVDYAQCGDNATRTADNTCACNNGFDNTGTDAAPICERSCGNEAERIAGVCRALCDAPSQIRGPDRICACSSGYEDPNRNDPNYAGDLVCLPECREDQIRDEGDVCSCPQGQAENTDTGMCETPSAPASGGGGGGGGAAVALIAVPAVMIGGYYFLGGFDYINPTYNLTYQGENGNLSYAAQGGFDLNHGNLNSYARAIQANGDAVEYQSGISYEKDYLALTYDAAESDSEYVYDFAASMKAEFGPFTIAPAAAAEFSYQRTGEEWSSDALASFAADWTAHRWVVKAQSAFAGAGTRYRLDIRREL